MISPHFRPATERWTVQLFVQPSVQPDVQRARTVHSSQCNASVLVDIVKPHARAKAQEWRSTVNSPMRGRGSILSFHIGCSSVPVALWSFHPIHIVSTNLKYEHTLFPTDLERVFPSDSSCFTLSSHFYRL